MQNEDDCRISSHAVTAARHLRPEGDEGTLGALSPTRCDEFFTWTDLKAEQSATKVLDPSDPSTFHQRMMLSFHRLQQIRPNRPAAGTPMGSSTIVVGIWERVRYSGIRNGRKWCQAPVSHSKRPMVDYNSLTDTFEARFKAST